MPNDDPPSSSLSPTAPHKSPDHNESTGTKSRSFDSSVFAVPTPVKRVFDKFPLVTHEANELPLRAPRDRNEHILHIFTTRKDADKGKPSFNPACLRWQAYLRFSEISFKTVSSSNHASPSGALPFLLPAVNASDSAQAPDPVASNKLKKWIGAQRKGSQVKTSEPDDVRYEAYASLIDNRIRKAWLYQLYLTPSNVQLLRRLYVEPCSSNYLVQTALAYQLQRAAETELVKSCGSHTLVEEDIMRDTEEALGALASLIGDDEWFFGQDKPGLLDASMFAYTHLILGAGLQWKTNALEEMIRKHGNLVQHQERIVRLYF